MLLVMRGDLPLVATPVTQKKIFTATSKYWALELVSVDLTSILLGCSFAEAELAKLALLVGERTIMEVTPIWGSRAK